MTGGHILTLRDPSGPPINMTGVLPGRLADDGAGITVIRGRDRHPLDALFDIRDGGPSSSLILRPQGAVLDAVGSGMAEGEILVEGDCGDHAGRVMRGGTLIVEGRCGAYAAATMQGGRLAVAGDAGDFLGAPLPGGTHGMAGGAARSCWAGLRLPCRWDSWTVGATTGCSWSFSGGSCKGAAPGLRASRTPERVPGG